jgi:predicted dehydrogenase
MFSALIVGAGQIAGGYDAPSDPDVLTHAHAYKSHGQFDFLGFYDVDTVKAEAMAEKWGVKAFGAPPHADVISICTPDDQHLATLKAVLSLKPRMVFLEKPLSNDPEEAREILELSKRIPIQVNYSRRFVKAFHDLKKLGLGRFLSGCGFYGKGFLHNGSHMLDLLDLLVGKIRKIDVVKSFVDFCEKDPTKTAVLTFEHDAKFFMQGVDCRSFTVFDLDLVFEKARVRILNSGYEMEVYEPREDPKSSGYKRLVLRSAVKTGLEKAMRNAVENIYQHLTCGAPLVSSASQAYEVFECLK